ncbi:MAG: hypothetical protein MUF03_01545 [Rubrivivax sp.]|jgi:general secretion pathway protein C|nr:hypothetical protein [Rubrivivax sp.]
MSARWVGFGVWAAVAASAVFWGLRLFAGGAPVPSGAVVASAAPPEADLSRVLGTVPEPEAPDDAEELAADDGRFVLVGVVAPRAAERSPQGIALIAVDGKPPRAYRVGATVDGDHVLQAVQSRGAMIGPRGGDAVVRLELPPLPPPATGVPGAAGTTSRPAGVAVPPRPGMPGMLRQPPPGIPQGYNPPAPPGEEPPEVDESVEPVEGEPDSGGNTG